MARPARPISIEPVDVYLGQRIRLGRESRGLSGKALAGELRISWQQLDKYERATNRVSAARLYQIAQVLELPVSWFYEGFAFGARNPPPDEATASVPRLTSEDLALVEASKSLTADQRRLLRLIAREFASGAAAAASEPEEEDAEPERVGGC